MSETRVAGAMGLVDALGAGRGEVISLVGGGGKTRIMFGVARELRERGLPVVTTTTTKIMEPRAGLTPHLHLCQDEGITSDFWRKLSLHRHVTLARGRLQGGKLEGIEPGLVSVLSANKTLRPIIIVEADGSAQRPFKAPNETEPVVPAETTLIVVVLGIEALGRPLGPEHVFRPEIYSRMTGLSMGQVITAESVALSLTHPRGLLRDRAARTRVAVFINKVENQELLAHARRLAEHLLRSGIPGLCRVIVGRAKHPSIIMDILYP